MKQYKQILKSTPIEKTNEQPVLFEPLLLFRTANECINAAKLKRIPNMLFGELWHEDEICILVADTNVGKSILGVQIADSISSGKAIDGFEMTAKKQKVLYFDFELSEKQFENRYSACFINHYKFDDEFYRIEINPNCLDFLSFEKQLFLEIEQSILLLGAKILVVDNLTYLKSQTTETSKEALPLMKLLKDLKLKHGLSILVLAHTPKRKQMNPININDIAGSSMLANFTDSAFAIGQSNTDKSYRYIKQLKTRATEKKHDSENVIVCQITKLDNFLKFNFIGFSNENCHLAQDQNNNELDNNIVELKRENPAKSNYAIAQQLNTNQMKVKRVLERNGIDTKGY